MENGGYLIVYKVREGDTLSDIAVHFHSEVAWLAQYNGISDPDMIRPGQTIVITGSLYFGRYRDRRPHVKTD